MNKTYKSITLLIIIISLITIISYLINVIYKLSESERKYAKSIERYKNNAPIIIKNTNLLSTALMEKETDSLSIKVTFMESTKTLKVIIYNRKANPIFMDTSGYLMTYLTSKNSADTAYCLSNQAKNIATSDTNHIIFRRVLPRDSIKFSLIFFGPSKHKNILEKEIILNFCYLIKPYVNDLINKKNNAKENSISLNLLSWYNSKYRICIDISDAAFFNSELKHNNSSKFNNAD